MCTQEVEEGELSEEEEEEAGVYMDESEVPPGKWRLGTSCEETTSKLFMRFATKGAHCISLYCTYCKGAHCTGLYCIYLL